MVDKDNEYKFPDPNEATEEGIVAIGGDLNPQRLKKAYENGIFPWFNEDEYIMWWSPDPRMVLKPEEIKISKSMRPYLNKKEILVTYNQAFDQVIRHCAKIKRIDQEDTWITKGMIDAYTTLHHLGLAKSVEVWRESELIGGLYGVDLGHIFCGESMFSLQPNASKIALIHLAKKLEKEQYQLIDCQVYTDHLSRMGAFEMPRKEFLAIIKN